nr:MAG TPA: hypothetical protein [Caudoviricetes sp.]
MSVISSLMDTWRVLLVIPIDAKKMVLVIGLNPLRERVQSL